MDIRELGLQLRIGWKYLMRFLCFSHVLARGVCLVSVAVYLHVSISVCLLYPMRSTPLTKLTKLFMVPSAFNLRDIFKVFLYVL